MLKTEAYRRTEHGSKYLQQLCKHFAHKVEVEFTPTEGKAAMPMGPALMRADADGLWVEVTGADAESLERAKGAIDRHLAKFAFREEFEHMPWQEPVSA